MRPIAACAEVVLVSKRVSQVTPETPGIPRAMVLRLIRALPGDRACLPPSPLRSSLPRNLMPASGHQDHTTSPSAPTPFVIGASASTASRSTSVAIASAPLTEQDETRYRLICDFGKSEYFCKGGWTRGLENREVICPPGNGSQDGSSASRNLSMSSARR
jgi:hypothetical protein